MPGDEDCPDRKSPYIGFRGQQLAEGRLECLPEIKDVYVHGQRQPGRRRTAAGTSSMPRVRCSAASRPSRRGCFRASTSRPTRPFIDTGDHVVVVNAAKVKLTGRKEDQKIYRQHSGYEGGLREERARLVRQRKPERLVEDAVHGMLPKTQARRGDVPQVESVRRSGSPARGAETLKARGRVTWQQCNITEPVAARHRPPACFSGPAPGPSTSTTKRSTRSSPPKRSARRFAQPLVLTETADKFDILATVAGGGVSGQAGAVRLGIARALVEYNLELRKKLKDEGLLTRDARAKERKKYGMAGARKRFQFSKR